MFIDRVTLKVQAGKGGNGAVAWRREKYLPKGGPKGGNGGFGGSVFLEADPHLYSLDPFRYKKEWKAENGGQGGPNSRRGKKGKDLTLKVPLGTLVTRTGSGELLADLTQEGQTYLLCEGGKGGLGNEFFKKSTRQAPNFATPGKPGEEKEVDLELKILADVGLVGFPNAGKSTLLNQISTTRAKTAPYPFTTLSPNLGFFQTATYQRYFIADIPGIIQGAHKDKGLGLTFLRHIERTKLLVFLLDASCIDGRDPVEDFRILSQEIAAYSPELASRQSLILLNKMDHPQASCWEKTFRETYPHLRDHTLAISALHQQGLDTVKQRICDFFP